MIGSLKVCRYYGLILSCVSLLFLGNCHAFAAVPNNKNGLSKLSVTELKRLLTERGIDFRDCLEKYELVQRLEDAGGSTNIPFRNNNKSYYSNSNINNARTEHENIVIDTFKRVSPSVAYITTLSNSNQAFSLQQRNAIPTGSGSGFLWDNQGHVVTNAHVVMASGRIPNQVKVKLQGMAESYDATVIGVEPEKDLAVLKISAKNLPQPMQVGTSNDLEVGQSVLAIGNPFGLDGTLSTGVISALGRDVNGFGGRTIKGCVQTDASINPGNSGGPLLDSRGRLIGVNTAIYSPNGGNVGIGFAIPVDTVRRVINQIIRYGKVIRPTMGIGIEEDRTLKVIEMQLRRTLNGVLVKEVIPNSPAEKAGLIPSSLRSDGSIILGDLITAVDGQPVKEAEDLLSAIEEKREGDVVTLRVQRNCDPRRVELIRVRLVSRDALRSSNNYNNNNGFRSPYGRRGRGSGVNNMADAWQ